MLLQGYLCLGDICMDLAQYSEAEEIYRKVLSTEEAADNLAGMIFDQERLCDCLMRQGRRNEAEPAIVRAVALETRSARGYAIARKMDPDKYLLTPTSLPLLHLCREDYEEASRLYRGQLGHWSTQPNRPGNIDLGQMQMQLAVTEERRGNIQDAVNAYAKAAEEFEREWCTEHPKVLAALKARATLEAAAAHGVVSGH
jgi:tetratricopeptide (TPR) repeat protein